MAEEKRVNQKQRNSKQRFTPKNKEQGSKKKRWKNHKKSKPVDIGTRLEQLQAYINGEFHQP